MTEKITLLVHARAPSSKANDETYHRQTEAYLNFKGKRIDAPSGSSRNDACSRSIRIASSSTSYENNIKPSRMIFLDETQLAYAALESQLATSSLVRPSEDQPPLETRASLVEVLLNPAGSKPTATEFIADVRERDRKPGTNVALSADVQVTPDEDSAHSGSTYLKTPILPRRKRVLESDSPDSQKNIRRTIAGRNLTRQKENKDRASIQNQVSFQRNGSNISESANETTSELPTTYSLSKISTDISPTKSCQSAPHSHTGLFTAGVVTVESTDPSQQREAGGELINVQEVRQPVSPDERLRKSSSPQISSETRGRHEHAPISQAKEFQDQQQASLNGRLAPDKTPLARSSDLPRKLSTTISPAEPEADQAHFITHVTDSLRFLLESPHVGEKYRPKSVGRELRPLERGHWLIDCKAWPLASQIEFWHFMEKTITGGNVGWGVWCVRQDDLFGETEDNHNTSIGPIKVFCWGEVVKHIYLMLYVASKGKVRNIGLQWIDSAGKVVVQMQDR